MHSGLMFFRILECCQGNINPEPEKTEAGENIIIDIIREVKLLAFFSEFGKTYLLEFIVIV